MLVELKDNELESVTGGLQICVEAPPGGTPLAVLAPVNQRLSELSFTHNDPGEVGNCDL